MIVGPPRAILLEMHSLGPCARPLLAVVLGCGLTAIVACGSAYDTSAAKGDASSTTPGGDDDDAPGNDAGQTPTGDAGEEPDDGGADVNSPAFDAGQPCPSCPAGKKCAVAGCNPLEADSVVTDCFKPARLDRGTSYAIVCSGGAGPSVNTPSQCGGTAQRPAAIFTADWTGKRSVTVSGSNPLMLTGGGGCDSVQGCAGGSGSSIPKDITGDTAPSVIVTSTDLTTASASMCRTLMITVN